jgi:hypothetical protein
MTDTILTRDQLEVLFYNLTVGIIGGSPKADIRRSWPTGGAPAFSNTDNVAFIKVYNVESPITQQREDVYSQIGSPSTPNMATKTTRTLLLDYMFYGQTSWDRANLVKEGLYRQVNHDILALQKIFVVPDGKPPQLMPELWQGVWYDRVNLKIYFNEGIVVNDNVPYIKTVEIVVEDRKGIRADITVEE